MLFSVFMLSLWNEILKVAYLTLQVVDFWNWSHRYSCWKCKYPRKVGLPTRRFQWRFKWRFEVRGMAWKWHENGTELLFWSTRSLSLYRSSGVLWWEVWMGWAGLSIHLLFLHPFCIKRWSWSKVLLLYQSGEVCSPGHWFPWWRHPWPLP